MKFGELGNSANRRKIVFVLPSFAAGGAERVLITLMNALDRSQYAPEMICLRKDGPLRALVAADIPVHAPNDYRKVSFGLPRLLKILRKTKPDIIVSTMAHMNFGVLMLRPFLPKSAKIIIREAITPSYVFDTVNSKWLVKMLYKILYPSAEKVISPAQAIVDEFKSLSFLKTDHFTLLYNPVNIKKIREEVPQILQCLNDERKSTVHFVCAGRLHPQKGFDRLIESLPWISHEMNWKLTILGKGDERDNLKALIEKNGLQDKVHLAGFSAAPWPQIGASDCFLLPSRYEGLPNVVLESLCVGTPVIALREAGGVGEIAGLAPEGSVTICEDMPEFLEAMRQVRPHPSRVYRPTLLPPSFRPEVVQKRFEALLRGENPDMLAPARPEETSSAATPTT